MTVTLRQLRYFIALAETGHFGRAAGLVHVSQPALSVQIRELEATLDAQLVDRQPRGVVLTPTGHEVLRHARAMMDNLRTLEQAARWRRGLAGQLTLGVIPTVAPYLLPVALPLLRAENVMLDLRVREAQTEALIADLMAGRLDAAVIALPSGQGGLVETELFEDRFLLAGSQSQIAALRETGDRLRPREIKPDRLLLLDEGHCLADQALEVCGLDRPATRVDLGASSLATLARLVSEGFGLTFLPEIALRAETAGTDGLALMRFAEPQPGRRIGLVRRGASQPEPWFEELAGLLRDAGERLLSQVSQQCGAA
ncbi:LysR family transcriptional regulator [Maritimibacter sp. 55A14]|uniref:hydrogen peroxide-inducible genes activator n=1 Tax=Maritimibacter sp. 55A14 TaxID=2174844 RepID=UPI000D60AE05|nr:hydrogen peroxide-inducible genes activator [Maritimibacter sp. 55A14]PWE33135.1 LysR family transcriptional regulator [Maritimibacter sp. 55A14]